MHLRRHARCVQVGATLVILAWCGTRWTAGAADETWVVQGSTYQNVRVSEVTGGSVTIFHRGGIAQLELAQLPPELQQRFQFDPAKAEAWKQQADAGLAESAELARVQAERRDALGRRVAREQERRQTAADLTGPVVVHASVDLRPLYQEHGLYLRDQGRRPSCSVFAVVGALEFVLAREYGQTEPLSEEYLIWATRRLQPGIPIDDGFHFEEVISALQSSGIPRKKTMPNTFGKSIDEIEPTAAAMSDAPHLRGVVPVWIRAGDPKLIERLVVHLNDARPIVIGLRWPHWRTLQHTALLSDQQPLEGAGHAVTLVGYKRQGDDLDSVVFVFRNSYGARWGAGGCGYVTANYLRQHLITAFHLTLPNPSSVAFPAP